MDTAVKDAAEIRTLVERFLETWRRRDPAAAAQYHTADGIVESPMYGKLQGRQAIEAAYRAFFTSFPDAAIETDAVVVEPPQVAVFSSVTATHVNEFFGLPGTGRRIDFKGCQLIRIENGAIAYMRRVYDFTGILLQVGVLRARPAKP